MTGTGLDELRRLTCDHVARDQDPPESRVSGRDLGFTPSASTLIPMKTQTGDLCGSTSYATTKSQLQRTTTTTCGP